MLNWTLLQLTDASFPAGGFAHSWGLEVAHQTGELPGMATWVAASLDNAAQGPLAVAQAVREDPDRFEAADAVWQAVAVEPVSNRASRSTGQALLATAARTFEHPALKARRFAVLREKQPGHLAPVVGAVAHALGLSADDTAQWVLYTTARDLVSAAIRLGVVGPIEGQRLLCDAGDWAARAAERATDVDWRRPITSFPLQGLCQARHDTLYSRLFHS